MKLFPTDQLRESITYAAEGWQSLRLWWPNRRERAAAWRCGAIPFARAKQWGQIIDHSRQIKDTGGMITTEESR